MPIVDVQLVGREAAAPAGLARAIADALAPPLGAAAGRVWVRLATLPPSAYAENGVAHDETPQPVFVTVLHADLPPAEALAAEAATLAQALAACLACPVERVHVEYAPAGRGRIAFGGRLLR